MKSKEKIQEITADVYELLKREEVTLREMEQIFGEVGSMARTSPEIKDMYAKWQNTPIK